MTVNQFSVHVATCYLKEFQKGYYRNGSHIKEIIDLDRFDTVIDGKMHQIVEQMLIYCNDYFCIFQESAMYQNDRKEEESIPFMKQKSKYPTVRRRS